MLNNVNVNIGFVKWAGIHRAGVYSIRIGNRCDNRSKGSANPIIW